MTLHAHITPAVLRWARETAGYSVSDVVARLNRKRVDEDVVNSWEAGAAKPTYAQFKDMAEFYHRPAAVFFMSAPPAEETLAEKFRSLPPEKAREIPPKVRFMARQARLRQIDLAELNAPMAFRLRALQSLQRVNVAALAKKTRAALGVTVEEQIAWRNAEVALKHWRQKIEDCGVWVFKDNFNADGYDGFCLPDDKYPVIYINNNKPQTRQIFTLLHELGHYLRAKGGVCFRGDIEQSLTGAYQREERFCNALAGHILLPDDGLRFARMIDDAEIERLANKYKVSKEVALRRYKDKGLIDWPEYNARLARWREHYIAYGANSKGGGNYYLTRKTYLGSKYLNLVFDKQRFRQISEYQAAEYLNVPMKNLSRLESVLHESGGGA